MSGSIDKTRRTMSIDGKKIRNDLHRMLTQAEIDLEMWQAMSAARRSEDVVLMLNRRYGRFYIAAENGLLNSMITILYAVFEVNIKSVNFWRLKDSLSDIASPSQISELNDTYASIKQLWKKISVIRNEVVGHQSLERTTKESNEKAGLTVEHARMMIVACQDLLYRIAKDFHDTHVVFNIKGTDSFDKLISDLRAWQHSKYL
jgi:hypothetical protein